MEWKATCFSPFPVGHLFSLCLPLLSSKRQVKSTYLLRFLMWPYDLANYRARSSSDEILFLYIHASIHMCTEFIIITMPDNRSSLELGICFSAFSQIFNII